MATKPVELGLRKLELFRHFGYVPHAAQRAVHQSKASRRIVACGVRWGKSTVGAHEAVAALLFPRERALGWIAAPTFDLTTRIAQRVAMTFAEHMPHRVVQVDARERSITIANLGGGLSTLRAKSTDRPASLLGESLDFLIIDEAAKVRREAWEEHMAPRLLDRGGWLLALSTPTGPGWLYDEWLRGGTDPAYASWNCPTEQNPSIDQRLIAAEGKRLPPLVFAEQYGAQWIGCPIIPCSTCHGPTRNIRTFVVHIDGEDTTGTCPACGRLTDGNGQCLVPLRHDGTEGEPRIVRISPGRGATDPPDPP